MAIINLCDIDLNGNALIKAVIHPLGTAPSTAEEGQIYYDTGDNVIYVNTSTNVNSPSWVNMQAGDITGITAGTGMTGTATSGAVTLNVVGGTGITANADDIAITDGGVGTTQIADDAVTEGKLANSLLAEIDANTAKVTNTDVDVSNANLLTRLAALESAGGAANQNIVIGTDSGDTIKITGNLEVAGTTTTVDSTTVAIGDSMLKLAKDQANTADAVDFGFYGQYGVSGTHKYAGVFRDLSATGDPFTFFDSLQAEPEGTVNTGGTGYSLANILAGSIKAQDGFQGNITGNVTGNADTVTTNANLTGHITSSGNAAVLGSFTVAQLSAALSNASISGNNTGDQTTVSGSSGSCTGNAATATALATSRNLQVALATTSAQGFTGAANATSIGVSGVLASANLDADTAHLTTTQTFTGAKTFTNTVALTGTGRITGIDTVSAGTDAANKTYVDSAITAARPQASFVLNNSTARVAVSNSNKTYTITHALGESLLYMVQVIRVANGSGETVQTCVTRTTTTVVINFNTAPTAGDYAALLIKVG